MKKLLACSFFALCVMSSYAARQMESLNRGLVAINTANGIFLSWRVLGTDGNSVGFNLYRDGEKIADFSGTDSTNYYDKNGNTSSIYTVKPVVNGTEGSGNSTSVLSDGYLTINLDRPAASSNSSGSYTYSPNDIAIGDVDGDGEFELILKWDPSNSKDNSQSGYTGNVFVDCYKLNGKKLWRIDLGVNIRAGAHYTQILVGDYDSDGYAEVAMKTAPGTKDGLGNYISKGAAASETGHTTDYRNSKGYVLSGNEYLTIFNGETGAEMATVNYNPARGTVKSWGDSYGNRVDRFLATNAYLDGQKPSMVFQRGYYTRMAIAAYDWDGVTLQQRWYYNASTSGSECYGQGNHNISAADVDGDGFDEIIEGSCAIDHNGKFKYRTGLGHGDAMHLGDLDPDRAGLEVWEVHEDKPYGYEMHDANTGEIIWRETSSGDNGRGVAADVDSTSRGYEMWSAANWNTYSKSGEILATSRPAYNFRLYFDGDLLDELLDNTTITKWNSSTSKSTTLLQMNGYSCNSTKATPNFSGDIFGDWREEVILHDNASKLYIYSTTITTPHRLYTLAHDPVYRLGMSFQNTAYNQPPHLGFWLGAGIAKAPTPDIVLVGNSDTPKIAAIQKQGAGSSFQTVMLGDSIVTYAFGYSNCAGLSITGLPNGVTATKDISKSRYVIAGTPTIAGTYEITITSIGSYSEEVSRNARITVLEHVKEVTAPNEILSIIDAAVPTDGIGTTDTDNLGFLGEGFFNFTNSASSYGIWKLNATKESSNATLVIRYALGGADTHQMELIVTNENGNSINYGVITFEPYGWTTYDSVSVNISLEKGLNVLTLQSISAEGGPNIDAFEFDIEGVTLYNETIVEKGEAETDFIQNVKVANGVHLNMLDNTIILKHEALITLNIFDVKGNLIKRFSKNLPAGATSIETTLNGLQSGHYFVQVKLNGKVTGHITPLRLVK